MRAGAGFAHGPALFSLLGTEIIMPTLYDHKVEPGANLDSGQASEMQTLFLTYSERQRNRLAVMLPDGQAAAIVLPRGQALEPGDVLRSADGQCLAIQAKPEQLLCARASSALELMRLVYHLANRHVRAMLSVDAIYIEPDPVLSELITKLGGHVSLVTAVFSPESGAYSGGHHHTHGVIDEDARMGNIGEQLSVQAHQGKHHGLR